MGHILVFLTGENEIKEFCYVLNSSLSKAEAETEKRSRSQTRATDRERFAAHSMSDSEQQEKAKDAGNKQGFEIILHDPAVSEKLGEVASEKAAITKTFKIFPLYSKLSLSSQQAIFEPAQYNCRHIIVATNIAETSVTIPDIKYVVDTGKEKKKMFSSKLCIQSH